MQQQPKAGVTSLVLEVSCVVVGHSEYPVHFRNRNNAGMIET